MLKLKNINKYYNKNKDNELHVLKDLNFNLEENLFVSIMGTSGVGKSTLLNIIGCIEDFDSGEYLLDGENINGSKKKKLDEIRGKKISYIYQSYMLIEEDTAIENVKVPLFFDERFKNKDIKKLSEDALLKVGLSKDIFNKKVSKLSGGQKQRVAIARAIVNNPLLILADEPTGALDEDTSKGILALFKNLITENLSIILVTHDIDIAKHADKIYNMKDGKLVEIE
ncbi:MAG: ABC transporter ATP-binding protein [Tissierellia bacterium]|nr:ABC transporter ATP-binding protein [Tissierellia bacterium]